MFSNPTVVQFLQARVYLKLNVDGDAVRDRRRRNGTTRQNTQYTVYGAVCICMRARFVYEHACNVASHSGISLSVYNHQHLVFAHVHVHGHRAAAAAAGASLAGGWSSPLRRNGQLLLTL